MAEFKTLNLRIPKDNWAFLRRKAFDREMSLSALINERLEKYKRMCEKKLTQVDANV